MAYTALPWKLSSPKNGHWEIRSQASLGQIATVFGTEEDARLIAAAPELYEALLLCLVPATVSEYGPDQEAMQRARKVIAKVQKRK